MSSFFCEKDPDIEFFLKEKSIIYEKIHKSSTYIVVDESLALNGKLSILGYFSLALQALNVPEKISINRRKILDGLSGKKKGSAIENFPCYLIGQLARCTGVSKDDLSGKYLLDKALSYIALAQESVGGRIVLVECKPDEKVIGFYVSYGFDEFTRIQDKDGKPMVQMIMVIES